VTHCFRDEIETFWVKWEWYPEREEETSKEINYAKGRQRYV